MDIWIPLALVAAGIAALGLEIFIPAGGILGVGGFFSIAAGVVMSFRLYGSGAGTGVLIFALVATPLVLITFLKIFPKTFLGRSLILDDPDNPVVLKFKQGKKDDHTGYEKTKAEDILAGQEGESITVLRPSGTALINGKKISVVTAGDFIEKNCPVRVVKAEGSRIVVKKI